MKKCRNKWNRRSYTVHEENGRDVVLSCDADYAGRKAGEKFTVSRSEYNFNYRENTTENA